MGSHLSSGEQMKVLLCFLWDVVEMWTGRRMFSKRSNLLPANCCQQSHFDTKLYTKETIYLWGSRGMNLKSSSQFFIYPSLKSSLKLERKDKLNGGDSLDRFGVPQFLCDSCNLSNNFNHTLLKEAEFLPQYYEFWCLSTAWNPFSPLPFPYHS